MENEIINANVLSELSIVVDGKPAKLNILGIMDVGGDKVAIVYDVPELDIGKDEYEPFHLIQNDGGLSIQSIDNDELYDKLCEAWDEWVRRRQDSDT